VFRNDMLTHSDPPNSFRNNLFWNTLINLPTYSEISCSVTYSHSQIYILELKGQKDQC